jgi:small subunit ribosomal protein S14
MAKKSILERNKRRMRLVAKYAARREALRRKIRDPRLSEEERQAAMLALQKLPRDSSYIRVRNRCALTGRPRGYYRKFGLGRNKLRELAMMGVIPGITKASW